MNEDITPRLNATAPGAPNLVISQADHPSTFSALGGIGEGISVVGVAAFEAHGFAGIERFGRKFSIRG